MGDFNTKIANGDTFGNILWTGALVEFDNPTVHTYVPVLGAQFDPDLSNGPVDLSVPFSALGAQQIVPIPPTIL